tara:strand:+ start:106 stop:687 length:582 start_codon:yes stop_codon:yes gene_type:complete
LQAGCLSKKNQLISRRSLLGVFGASVVSAAPVFTNAAGFIKGAGDIRKLKMISDKTGERIDTIYWIDGGYIPEALHEIDVLMRDWRRNEVKPIDLRTIDILAASHSMLDTAEPFRLMSGYRSAKTNAMLRRQSRSVSKNSLHITGQAADVRLGTRSVKQLAKAAQTCKSGGVGKYSRSNFVHLDCGPVRLWGR